MFLRLLLTAGAAIAASPPVQVSLRTSWPASPLLVEVIETVALESPASFFPFLDCVTNPNELVISPKSVPEAVYKAGLALAVSHGFLPDPGALAAVEMNLALHAVSPKVQAFYHYYHTTNSEREVDCGSWVDWYGTTVCDVETLAQLARIETIDPSEKPDSKSTFNRPHVLPFDHIYPLHSLGDTTPPRTAILYASFQSPNFRELHEYLYQLASPTDGPPLVEYILRYIPPETPQHGYSKTYLSGYSIALDLKKMDYLALDDRHIKKQDANGNNGNAANGNESPESIDPIHALINAYPEPDLQQLETHSPSKDSVDSVKEKEEQEKEAIASLGLQAAQLLYDAASSQNPIQVLVRLSQNFPKYFPLLNRANGPRIQVSSELAKELHNNQLRAQPGGNVIWINGQTIQDSDINPFGLLRILKKERTIIQTLTSFGLASNEKWFSNGQAIELLTHKKIAAAQDTSGSGAVVDGLLDVSDRPEGEGAVVIWWNDLEKDSRYTRWQFSIHAILQPLYPGQFPSVKLNLFNIVLVLDLSKTSSVNFLAGAVSSIIQKNFPFRWGIVPFTASEDGMKMARLFYYLMQNHGRKNTMELLGKISQLQIPSDSQTSSVNWKDVRSAFSDLMSDSDPEKAVNFDQVLSGKSSERSEILDKIQVSIVKTNDYLRRLGLDANDGKGYAFVNGKYFEMSDNFLNQMQIESRGQLQYLQEQLYEGHIVQPSPDPDDPEKKPFSMSNFFNDLPTTAKRRNKYIVPLSADKLKLVNLPEVVERSGWAIPRGGYIYPRGSGVLPVTIHVVADLNNHDGLSFLKEALLSVETDSPARISFIHNPVRPGIPETLKSPPMSALFSHLIFNEKLEGTTPNALLTALGFGEEVVYEPEQNPLTQGEQMRTILGDLRPHQLDYVNHTKYVEMGRRFLKELGVNPGDKGVVINGRVISPLGDNDFRADDFKALQVYEMRKRITPVVAALEDIKGELRSIDRTSLSDLISMVSSFIASIQLPDPSEVGLFDAPQRPRSRNYRMLESEYTCFEYGDNTTALYQVAALLDPLSETAQRWSSLLEWISNIPDISIEIHMNPAKYNDVPLKRFFRYNLRSTLIFGEDGYEIPAQTVLEGLPIEPIYTLAIETSSSWLVRPRRALYDLDNIQLNHLAPEDDSVDATFELDYLVVEGHARDTNTNAPPRGVQLELTSGNATNPIPIDDTQVVANLGYFQFQATPGVFRLGIREGRGRDIFEMESVGNEGWDSRSVVEVGDEITVTSFEGLTLYPRLMRKKGMEKADVLAEEEDEEDEGTIGNFVNNIMSIFSAKPKETSLSVVPGSEQAEINIFTVASGLLYERFVGIMILSVLRNTKSTVKFWFIENFLSPSFLEFIPHLASAYNFQYELVTYKWPSWLRAQKEKQRIIWAYKILFLDVLFPMDLERVIFVDADQIVRADLKELVEMDLQGAPYGYTPMGDDNYDMEGFRFWKTGYWKEFLQGRPYHISALYVVDLLRFRKIAAGDILRGQYHALSADPGSLANLDQDLPNNLQREVPIFSLHEDWLWCETWCSKDRLHRAKTIDLCQNPLTKEPKLSRARQIPEWEEYDSEIARFVRKLVEEGTIKSRIAIADVNVLANAGFSGKEEVKEKESDTEKIERVDGETEQVEINEAPRDEL